MGTLPYMSPNQLQLRGQRVDRSDIFSLGDTRDVCFIATRLLNLEHLSVGRLISERQEIAVSFRKIQSFLRERRTASGNLVSNTPSQNRVVMS